MGSHLSRRSPHFGKPENLFPVLNKLYPDHALVQNLYGYILIVSSHLYLGLPIGIFVIIQVFN
jgi:hypothetical protein